MSNETGLIVFIFIAAVVLGIIPAAIAQEKGYNFFAWWVFGTLLFIVALLAAFLIGPTTKKEEERGLDSGELERCPDCAEPVRAQAARCRFCGHWFDDKRDGSSWKFSDEVRPRKS